MLGNSFLICRAVCKYPLKFKEIIVRRRYLPFDIIRSSAMLILTLEQALKLSSECKRNNN